MPKPMMLQIQLDKQSAEILNELKSRNLKGVFVNSAIKHYAKNCENDIFFDDSSNKNTCAPNMDEYVEVTSLPKAKTTEPESKPRIKEW
jgi:hypothetical protein